MSREQSQEPTPDDQNRAIDRNFQEVVDVIMLQEVQRGYEVSDEPTTSQDEADLITESIEPNQDYRHD